MLRPFFFLLIFTPLFGISQTVTGKLYDDKTTAKNVKVLNAQKKIQNYSDENGDFKISATIGDSLVLQSLFYERKILIINQEHFNHTIVIQLKKVVNKLDEVLLSDKSKFKEFNAEEHNTNLNLQFENDKKNRPYLYSSYQSGGMDFVAIAKLIGKLFKKKRPDPIRYVTHKELDSLFKNNSYFNQKFLTNTLKITDDLRFLFFDYCEAQTVNMELLFKKNQFLLVDTLLNHSKSFRVIISEPIKD